MYIFYDFNSMNVVKVCDFLVDRFDLFFELIVFTFRSSNYFIVLFRSYLF